MNAILRVCESAARMEAKKFPIMQIPTPLREILKRIARSNALTSDLLNRALYYRRIERQVRMKERRRAAQRYLRGEGIEIGALHLPQFVPKGAHVRYVDQMDEREARRDLPELANFRLVGVDIVEDGEKLTSIGAQSLDFIIANHVIEHCENPLQTIENWLSKLKRNGILFMAVPDMAYTFDQHRAPTSPEHLIWEWQNGSDSSAALHYEEYGNKVCNLKGSELENYVKEAVQSRRNIHFHAWRANNFLRVILEFESELCKRHNAESVFDVELCMSNEIDFLVVLRKQFDGNS